MFDFRHIECVVKNFHLSCYNFSVQGSFTSTGLVVSSKLPRFSDMYTLSIASADPKSISANETVQFTKSVTQWSVSLSLYLHICMHAYTHTLNWFFEVWSPYSHFWSLVMLQVHEGGNFGGGPLLERRWSINRWICKRTKEEQVIWSLGCWLAERILVIFWRDYRCCSLINGYWYWSS